MSADHDEDIKKIFEQEMADQNAHDLGEETSSTIGIKYEESVNMVLIAFGCPIHIYCCKDGREIPFFGLSYDDAMGIANSIINCCKLIKR
jgi:hypothetical protein